VGKEGQTYYVSKFANIKDGWKSTSYVTPKIGVPFIEIGVV
jgi:hypothetical protein